MDPFVDVEITSVREGAKYPKLQGVYMTPEVFDGLYANSFYMDTVFLG